MLTDKFPLLKIRNAMLMLSRHLLNELIAERTVGSKALLLQRHVLFGLRVKGGIFNQAVYKQPNVVLHLEKKKWSLSCFSRKVGKNNFTHIVVGFSGARIPERA